MCRLLEEVEEVDMVGLVRAKPVSGVVWVDVAAAEKRLLSAQGA